MKTTTLRNLVLGIAALAASTAQANLLIAYNPDGVAGNAQFGLFSDTGILLRTYATGLLNTQRATVDNAGNGYFADANSGVYKYNIATGAGGLLFSQAGYTPLGLGFNANRPGEILLTGADSNDPKNTIARIDSTTGAILAGFQTGGTYTDAEYDSGTGKVVATIGISLAQTFDPVTLEYLPPNLAAITGQSQTVTSLGGVLYYGGNNGEIRTQSDTLIFTLAGVTPNAYDITNDGTNLIAVDYNNGTVSRFTTAGVLINSFDVGFFVSGVAFTAVPEPSTYALVGLSLFALVAFRRSRRAV